MRFLKYIIIILLLVGPNWMYGQKIIKGRIIDESLSGFPGANVYNTNFTLLGTANFDGYFEINIPVDIDKLIITSLGYENSTISIPKKCDYIEFILLGDGEYHYSSRKVDRIRKKRFDKLNQIHLTAFNKGIFINDSSCYKRVFEPYKPEIDEIGRQMKLTKKQIKKKFKELVIGDTVKIPSESWSAYTDETDFGCLITGTIIEKNKKKGGYNLILKVTNNLCEKHKTTYNGNPVNIGDSITHNMKYDKIITN